MSAERAWLNALSNIAATDVEGGRRMLESSRLTAEDFGGRAEADLFRASVECLKRGAPLELISLEASLAASVAVRNAGGRKFLAEVLLEPAQWGDSAAEHARLILDASLRRRASVALSAALSALANPATLAPEALAEATATLSGLTNATPGLGTSEGDIFRLAEMLDAAQAGRRELVIPSGITSLDAEIGGLQPGVLTLIGALPGVGKSSLLATIARNVVKSGRRVGFFSLEDERIWLTRRFLALESGVPVFKLATRPLGVLDRDCVHEAMAKVHETLQGLIIDDRPALSPAEVAATAVDMIRNHGAKAIIVDHLGEMRFSRSERYDLDVADALSVLRDVAKRHNVPVIVASHVKRRQGLDIADPPNLTDFANSSAPERMARVALGLFKPEAGILGVQILKQTNGPAGRGVALRMLEDAAMVNSTAVLGDSNENH